MADLKRIERALRNAHAAGDVSAARRLAQAYRQAQQATVPAQPETPNYGALANERFAGSAFMSGSMTPDTDLGRSLVAAGDEVLDAAKETVGDAADFVTGSDRRIENVPNLLNSGATFGLSMADQAELAGRLLMANDKERQREAVKDMIPGVSIYEDENGFDIISKGDQIAYINGPGLSQQDVAKGVVDSVMLLPAVRGMKAATKIPGLAGKLMAALGIGAGSGAALSVGQDVISNVTGDGEGVNVPRASLYAVGGALGETGGILANRVARMIGGKEVTEEVAERAAPEMGIDYGRLAPDQQTEFRRLLRLADNPEEFKYQLQSLSQPVPVPLTKGRATPGYDRDQLLAESEMIKSSDPQMLARQEEVRAALIGNANALKSGSPNDSGLTLAGAGERISSRLTGMRRSEKQAMDRAWDAARDKLNSARRAGSEPTTSVETLSDSVDSVRRQLMEEGFDETTAPGPIAQLNRLVPAEGESVPLSSMLSTVNRLNALSRGQGPEAVAAGRASRALQNQVDELMATGLMTGDTEILDAFKRAGAMRKEFGDRWEAKDIFDRLTVPLRNGRGALSVDPSEAANVIFGASASSITSKPKLAKELAGLKRRLGADSPDWDAVRQAGVEKLMTGVRRTGDFDVEDFSGTKFKQTWVKAKRENPEVVKELFTDQQRAALDDFAEVADRATRTVSGGNNFSNTARGVSMIGNTAYRMGTANMGPPFLKWLGALPAGWSLLQNILKEKRVADALAGIPVERIGVTEQFRVPGIAMGASGLGQDQQGEYRTQQ